MSSNEDPPSKYPGLEHLDKVVNNNNEITPIDPIYTGILYQRLRPGKKGKKKVIHRHSNEYDFVTIRTQRHKLPPIAGIAAFHDPEDDQIYFGLAILKPNEIKYETYKKPIKIDGKHSTVESRKKVNPWPDIKYLAIQRAKHARELRKEYINRPGNFNVSELVGNISLWDKADDIINVWRAAKLARKRGLSHAIGTFQLRAYKYFKKYRKSEYFDFLKCPTCNTEHLHMKKEYQKKTN